MPIEGVDPGIVKSYTRFALLRPLLCVFVFYLLGMAENISRYLAGLNKSALMKYSLFFILLSDYVARLRAKSFVIGILIFVASLTYGAYTFRATEYLNYLASSTTFYEEHYIAPDEATIRFPITKRNLILVFLESMETTYFAKDEGGAFDNDLIPELKDLAKENINFSHNGMIGGAIQIAGTGWTTAGLVSHLFGIPLMLGVGGYPIDFVGKTHFFSGAKGLTDILHLHGYRMSFLIGSDKKFGGRDILFETHGETEVKDINYYKKQGELPLDYMVWWGFEDRKLYHFAKDEIASMSSNHQPFALILLTVDTHHIGGYLCELCGNKYPEQYKNVLECASKQVVGFVQWVQSQPFYENTTIVIVGDHLYMDSQFFPDSISYDERHAINIYINSLASSDKRQKNRRFSTLDTFPTILDAMGASYDGPGLGLGRSLFRDSPTLVEKYGVEYINKELSKKSATYDRLLYGE